MFDFLFKKREEAFNKRIAELESLIIEIKGDFELRESMWQERVQALEEKLKHYEHPKNSENSSVAPSQDPYRKKYPKKEKSGRSSGGQKGHKGHHHAWSETVDDIVPLNPQSCPHCGSENLTLFPENIEARQEVDIPPLKPSIREYRAMACQCQNCGKRSRADFPEHIKTAVQMGENVGSLAVYLKTLHHASHNKIAALLQDIFGLSVSHGWVQNVLERAQ